MRRCLHLDDERLGALLILLAARRLGRRQGARGEGNALDLPAGVSWAVFLKLWKMYNMSLLIKDGDRELLRVEVLEARADGMARFRLWYYKWRETKPH